MSLKSPNKRSEEVAESNDMVNMSQNTENLTNKLKKVRHADDKGNASESEGKSVRSKSSGKSSALKNSLKNKVADSEDPS